MDGRRPSVLVLIRHYLPGFRAGGPIRSVANLVQHLHADFDFHVLCLNRDFRAELPYPDIAPGQTVQHNGTRVTYVTRRDMLPWGIASLLASLRYDVLYLNSF